MDEHISSTNFEKLQSLLNQDGTKIEELNDQTVDFGVFKGELKITDDVRRALLKFNNNTPHLNFSSGNKPEATQINPDGSGTKIIRKTDKNGNTREEIQKLGPGGKVLSKNTTVKNKDGKLVAIQNTSYTYDKQGNLKKTKNTTKKASGTIVTEASYGENGKVAQMNKEVTTKKNGKTLKTKSRTDYNYDQNNNLKNTSVRGKDPMGKPFTSEIEYKDGKMVKKHSTQYVRGALTEQFFDTSSAAGIPSTKITYGPDGKTIQEKIENTFDSDGILSSQKITDTNGKIITHDYSKVDGNFDIGNQISRGDCYLLAAINALRQSPHGHKALQQTIKESVDENGNKIYTVSFPGAKIARESLISGEGDAGIPALPKDKVHIQESYTITEEELKQALKQQGKKYSVGDRDVVLLEIGFEQYRKDVNQTVIDNKIDTTKTQYIAGLSISTNTVGTDDVLRGGQPADALFILTGQKAENLYNKPSNEKIPTCYINSDLSMTVGKDENFENKKATAVYENNGKTNNVDKILNKLQKDCEDGKLDEYAATAGFKVSQQEVNGEILPGSGHALTITKVTDKTVELSNPWDPAKTIVMSREDFKRATFNVSATPVKKLDTPQQPPVNNQPTTVPLPTVPSKPPVVEQTPVSSQQNNKPNYTVPQGKGYNTMIREALVEQGIKNPTKEQIAKAKEQFVAANPEGTVHIYNGSKKAYIGNPYLLTNAKVYIPKFDV